MYILFWDTLVLIMIQLLMHWEKGPYEKVSSITIV